MAEYYFIIWIHLISFIHSSTDRLFILFPFCIILPWIFIYRILCRCIFSVLLDMYPKVKLVDHTVTLCLTFWGIANYFPESFFKENRIRSILDTLLLRGSWTARERAHHEVEGKRAVPRWDKVEYFNLGIIHMQWLLKLPGWGGLWGW